jgi:hypothetical protein
VGETRPRSAANLVEDGETRSRLRDAVSRLPSVYRAPGDRHQLVMGQLAGSVLEVIERCV